jgi:acetyl-CoA carboxylase biotin carboxyl carrier protein
MLINQIKKLIKLVEESEIDELEVSRWGSRIRIRKNLPDVSSPSATVIESKVPDSRQSRTVDIRPEDTAKVVAEEKVTGASNEHVVKAPMVGTFYRASSPESSPFVEIGSRVSVGQTLCIIEAMKLMNELPSEVNGIVNKILVENGEPIEYGQDLFIIVT